MANYLFTEGFRSAAENFSREAGLAHPIDLTSLESRMDIRRAVQRGDVEQATEMVNELDPEVSARLLFGRPLSRPRLPSLPTPSKREHAFCSQRLYCTMHHSQGQVWALN